MENLHIKSFFDPQTYTFTYVVWDSESKSPSQNSKIKAGGGRRIPYTSTTKQRRGWSFEIGSKDALVIDPVLNYDPKSSTYSFESLDVLSDFLKSEDLNVHYILETHAHADHLTSSQFLKQRFPKSKIGIGKHIIEVQKVFHELFNFGSDYKNDGSQFDLLLEEGQTIQAGTLEVKVIETPGHTPACVTYLIGDSIFSGDALFIPDSGTGRCDFPKGDAKTLYSSISKKIYSLPDNTRIFVGHDYQPNGREVLCETTVAEQKEGNIHLKASTTEEEYVNFRTKRDSTLSAPALLFPSIQFNAWGGYMIKPESNNVGYLKIPFTQKK